MASNRNSKDGTRTPLSEAVKERARDLRKWRYLLYPAGLWIALLVLGVTVALLANPAAVGSGLPLSDEDVGKVATADIRAPISFTVPDVESTERKRREAEEAERSMYDFRQELGNERIRRLKEAFAEMSRVITEHQEAIQALEHAEPEEEPAAARKKKRRTKRRPRKRPRRKRRR